MMACFAVVHLDEIITLGETLTIVVEKLEQNIQIINTEKNAT